MSMTVDWATQTFTIPQSDLSLVTGALYDFDTDAHRLELKAIEASEAGIVFIRTHNHNTAVTIAGVTYARTVEMLNGYSITFEDTGSAYAIRYVGSNNNLFDVENGILNVTAKVSYIPGNSAGLIATDVNVPALSTGESEQLADMWTRLFGGRLYENPVTGKEIISGSTGAAYSEADVWSDDGVTGYDGTAGIARRDGHVKP